MDTSIQYLPGVGPKRAELLQSELGISTVGDLVRLYPFRYIDRSVIVRIADVQPELAQVQVKATVLKVRLFAKNGAELPPEKLKYNAVSRMSAIVSDGSGEMETVFFKGVKWMHERLKPGSTFIFFGKPAVFNNRLNMVHPEVDAPDSGTSGVLTGVYPSTEKLKNAGITGKVMLRMMSTALAEILFGEVNPSGHLPLTFYRSVEDLPAFEDYSMKNRTYRYFSGDVLYPFGYGLSYTKWEIARAEKAGNTIIADVSNKGKMSGDAVIQVYVRCESPDAPLHPRLCGFARISIPAGETRTVSVPLDKLTDTVVNEQGERIKAEKAVFFVGMSQPDEKSVSLCGVKPAEIR